MGDGRGILRSSVMAGRDGRWNGTGICVHQSWDRMGREVRTGRGQDWWTECWYPIEPIPSRRKGSQNISYYSIKILFSPVRRTEQAGEHLNPCEKFIGVAELRQFPIARVWHTWRPNYSFLIPILQIPLYTWSSLSSFIHLYLKSVISPTAEFHHAGLFIKRKILNIHFTRRVVNSWWFPLYSSWMVECSFCTQGDFKISISTRILNWHF